MSYSRTALERFLDRLLLRSSLSEQERRAILGVPTEHVRHGANYDFVRPGETTDFACLVAEGLAARFDQLANGHRQIVAMHVPGDMCDLHSVASPHAGWGIQSLCEVGMLLIPHRVLQDLAVKYPAIAFAFWRDTVTDTSVLAKWLAALGRRPAKQRMAHLLCEMGLRMEHAGLGTRANFPLRVTQTQLADVLGLTPVHLNRSLQALRGDGLLWTDGRDFEIHDVPALWHLAEFDPTYLLLHGGDRPVRADGAAL